ncbi:MAG: aminotransferase class I/II-fold pyridoxal phosphate-dependent enzyme, partial [Methanocorpusculum sp.]|nr:aminotransferase class I/II-fold pyridoxal phosphate-dependent enzyme [Methanocorpusculum sp.]
MRNFIADVAASIPPSGIRKFFDLVLTMDSSDVISLGVGEPDFDTPYAVSKAAISSIEMGKTMYTANRGLPQLCSLLSEDLKKRYHVSYNPASEIIFTSG